MPLAEAYQMLLAQMAEAGGPPMTEMTPAQAREAYRLMRPVNLALKGVTTRAANCADPDGGTLPLRIYRPVGDGPFGVLVYFHGGGWVIGDLDTGDALCRTLAAAAGCVIVAVDYRLAPEHPYPAAVDDCYAATVWAAENAAALEGNGRLAVGGESAGGNLAAVVCLKARDENGPAIALQWLAYPVVDCDLGRASYEENGSGMLLETDTMRWFWGHYLSDAAKREASAASPLRAASHDDLPPALILTAEYDPLRDEGAAYAQVLEAAGIAVEYRCCSGLIHDFLATAAIVPGAQEALTLSAERLAERLRAALG